MLTIKIELVTGETQLWYALDYWKDATHIHIETQFDIYSIRWEYIAYWEILQNVKL